MHGDLKPRNVRITPDGHVKVLDFGIAKALSLSRKVTRNDFGSMAYLSPERLESGEVDAYADYWAVGVLLHEMLTGSQPFQAPDTHRLERMILARQPPPALAADCPVAMQAVVAKLLAPDPVARYGDALAIREDLELAAAAQQTSAEREGWPARAYDESPTKRTRPPEHAESDATRRTTPPSPAVPLVIPPIPGVVPPPLPASAATALPASALPRRRKRRWLRRLAVAALLFMVLGNLARDMSVAAEAERLAATIPTRGLEQLAEAWNQHDRLSRRSGMGFGLRDLERSLTERTEALANTVVENYRSALPSVREAQWRVARGALEKAVAVSPEIGS